MKAHFIFLTAATSLVAAIPACSDTTAISPPVASDSSSASSPANLASPADGTSSSQSAPEAVISPTTPPSLSLASVLDTARSGSLSIEAAEARIQAAQARLRAAKALPGTTLTLAHAYGRNTGGFDEDVVLSQTIEFGKTGPRVKGARAEQEAAQFDRAGAGTDLQFAIRSAYYDAERADVELDLAKSSLLTAQTFQTAAQNQFTAGDVPRANVLRSSIELSRAQAALDAAKSDRTVRYEALKSLLGMGDDAPLQLADKLQFAPLIYDLAALQQLANARADLESARAMQKAKIAGVQIARSGRLPDGFIEGRRAAISNYPDTPNGSSIRFGVVIPLFDFGRTRASVSEAQASAREQQALLDQTERSARLDVATAYEHFVAAQSAVQSFNAGRLDQSRELLDMAQVGYEHGANSYLEVLDAQTVYRNEQVDYARALAAWNTAQADLERAVGGKLP